VDLELADLGDDVGCRRSPESHQCLIPPDPIGSSYPIKSPPHFLLLFSPHIKIWVEPVLSYFIGFWYRVLGIMVRQNGPQDYLECVNVKIEKYR
jgi:hypothetical protein